ncbi:MAG: hypothetical protein Q9226_006824 [Calogaya cf. arnoldii]
MPLVSHTDYCKDCRWLQDQMSSASPDRRMMAVQGKKESGLVSARHRKPNGHGSGESSQKGTKWKKGGGLCQVPDRLSRSPLPGAWLLLVKGTRQRVNHSKTPGPKTYGPPHNSLRAHIAMPTKLASSLLTVDTAKMHHIDTRNAENLYSMWSGKEFRPPNTHVLANPRLLLPVFSKCAESIEDGRRLENLSWRIWNRETLCCEPQPHLATTPPIHSNPQWTSLNVPDLSASVDSISSDEDEQTEGEDSSLTAPMDIQVPRIHDPESRIEPSKGREKHITSLKLERMVVSIKEKKDITPLSPSITDAVPQVFPSRTTAATPSSPTINAPLDSSDSSASTAPLSGSDSDHSMKNRTASDTSAELLSSHSVVRGFSPSHVSSSYRSSTHLAPSPIPAKSIAHGKNAEPKPSGMFLLGGSSGEEDSSFDDQMLSQPKHSSLTAGLRKSLHPKKQTSFKDEVESRTINNRSHEDEDVFESDDEEEDFESAIKDDEEAGTEEDDGSDWEDSVSETAEPPASEKHTFQRVDSKPNLVSRRSLLTTLMNQPDRAAAFANMASKSTSALRRSRRSTPSAPSTGTSPEAEPSVTMRGSHMAPAKPIIMTTSNTHTPALSPRSTRRHMLATELTESLRKHLLWERQQKSTTANAFLKRRHTAHDMANLQEYPGSKAEATGRGGSKTSSLNDYFAHGLSEYNQTGCSRDQGPKRTVTLPKEDIDIMVTHTEIHNLHRFCLPFEAVDPRMMESQMNDHDELALLASPPALPNHPKRPCRYYLSPKGCRAGDKCPFVHDRSKLEQVLSPGHSQQDPVRRQPSAIPVQPNSQPPQHRRRNPPPQVDPSRVVQKPISRQQKDDPRQFQIGQLERRFSTTQKTEDGGSTLSFQLAPSDPDFPFELAGLDCVLRVPEGCPENGRPSLAVANRDMPRGYQINIERGFNALAQASPHATLLSLLNALDKQLEALLTGPKAETIKIVSNAAKQHSQPPYQFSRTTEAPKASQNIELSGKEQRELGKAEPYFTSVQRNDAEARRQLEIRQLEARLGRLPLFSKSSDGILFTLPISPRKPGDLPVPLQAVRSVKLLVPLLYPLHPCRIELPGVNKEVATKTETGFNTRAKDNRESSLMAHINYFAQHMHTMAIEPEIPVQGPDQVSVPSDGLTLDEKAIVDQRAPQPEDDRSHIKIIPRPPEWAMGSEEDTDSDNDFSDPYDSGDESDDDGSQEGQEDHKAPGSTIDDHSTDVVERGISLNFPSLELHNIELLEVTSLSISIKCTRCKTSSDIANLRPSSPRESSCPKCAQSRSVSLRCEPMHINSARAGYLDLTGCTISDMLPSAFTPTCATCSTAVPAPGVVSVRGDATSIAICRECHGRLSFKIPETKFTLVSNTSLHPRKSPKKISASSPARNSLVGADVATMRKATAGSVSRAVPRCMRAIDAMTRKRRTRMSMPTG